MICSAFERFFALNDAWRDFINRQFQSTSHTQPNLHAHTTKAKGKKISPIGTINQSSVHQQPAQLLLTLQGVLDATFKTNPSNRIVFQFAYKRGYFDDKIINFCT
jgi:ribosomal protein S4E